MCVRVFLFAEKTAILMKENERVRKAKQKNIVRATGGYREERQDGRTNTDTAPTGICGADEKEAWRADRDIFGQL